jgi:1-acyl-sn-glycerol-3-phosphate acyltransferase
MAEFKKGPAMIATELGIPIVPAYIDGTFAAMPKGSRFIRPRGIHVRIGRPIHPADYTANPDGGTHKHIYERITAVLEQSVHQLMRQNDAPELRNQA